MRDLFFPLVSTLLFCLPSLAAPLKILTYESMTGHHSFGEFLKEEFAKSCPKCEVKFVTTHELSGLLGKMRSDRRRHLTVDYDLVMGLDADHYQAARDENLVEAGQVFDRSPFALIVDTQRLPQKEWPLTWRDLPKKLKENILVEDPRLSEPGLGWLKAIFAHKLIEAPVAKSLVKRVFPSWNSAYSAFLKGEGLAVWSFWSSEAYHRCQEKTERYQALPLREGYPGQEEWIATIKVSKPLEMAKNFVSFLSSEKIQNALPQKNWMYPELKSAKLPDCFSRPSVALLVPTAATPLLQLQKWMDEWSL